MPTNSVLYWWLPNWIATKYYPLLLDWRSYGLAGDCSLFSRSHTWLASSEEVRSLQNQQFSCGAFTRSRFDWRRGCVCVYECVCVHVSACLRPWEGWLCKPKLAPAMPQSLSEMKDDGSTEPSSKGRIFTTNSYKNKYTPNRHTKAVIYDTATIIGIFFRYKTGPLSLLCTQRQIGNKGWGAYLEEELHHTIIDAGDPQ